MTEVPETGHVRFPPHWAHLLIPARPRAATALGMTMYTASKPKPLLVQHAAWAAVRVGGSGLLRTERSDWDPPMGRDAFAELWQTWCDFVPNPAAYAVYGRLQATRSGCVVLLCAGSRSAVVRLRPDAGALDRERAVQDAAAARKPAMFRVPERIAHGSTAGWHWLASHVMSRRPHRPARAPIGRLCAGVSELVEVAFDRPPGTPEHWTGAHGDLNPWNLRRGGGSRWLIDWEDARFAPPGYDELYWRATRQALRARPPAPLTIPAEQEEAAAVWADQLRTRAPAGGEHELHDALRIAFRIAVDH